MKGPPKAKSTKELRHRLLVIVGAFAVLATFIAKDIVHEQAKERLDAIETAQSIFLVRRDVTDLHDTIYNLSQKVDSVENELMLKDDSGSMDPIEGAREHLNTTRQEAGKAAVDLDNADRLRSALPERLRRNADRDLLKTRLGKNREVLGQLKPTGPISPRDFGTIFKNEMQTKTLTAEVAILAGELSSEADKVKEEAKRHLTYASWLNILAYIFAFVLVVVGRLYGIKEFGGGE